MTTNEGAIAAAATLRNVRARDEALSSVGLIFRAISKVRVMPFFPSHCIAVGDSVGEAEMTKISGMVFAASVFLAGVSISHAMPAAPLDQTQSSFTILVGGIC
jgi:hypothetical protein